MTPNTTTPPSDGYVRWTRITPSTTSVTLTWTAYHASTFMVRRDDGTGTPTPTGGTLVYSGTELRAVDTTVTAWTRYRYVVWADDGAGGYLRPAAAVTTTSVQTVLGLTVTLTSASTATVAWTAPTDPGVAAVVVTRTDPSGAVRTVYSGTGTTVTDSGLLVGRGYSYTAVAQDASGRSGPAGLGVAVTPKRTWTTTVASPYAGWPGALACATSTWCLAVDNTGSYQVMSGSTWSKAVAAFPASPDPEWEPVVTSLTCPAVGRCSAISLGRVVEFSNGGWRSAGAPSSGWTSLACPSTTYCVAVRRDGWSTTRVGTTWTSPARIGTLRGVDWNDVSCQAAARCFAIASGSSTSSSWRGTLTGTAWSTGFLAGYQTGSLSSISCSSSTCLALGEGVRVMVSGTAWSVRSMDPNPSYVSTSQVSCASPTLCVALNFDSVDRWSGGSVVEHSRLSANIGRVRAVSCPRSGSACFAVDDRGRFYRWTPTSHWALTGTYVQTTGGVGRVGCRTADSCFFVDRNGWLVAWNGARWTRSAKYFTQPATVQCSGPGFCIAVENVNKVYRVWSGGAWGASKPMPLAAADVSCASPTLCLGVDEQGRVSRFNGSSWSTPVTALTSQWSQAPGVSCPAGGPCMLVASNGTYRQYSGSGLTPTRLLPSTFPADGSLLSCGSPTMCIAVVDSGDWVQWNGSTWTVHAQDFTAYRLGTLTCITADDCAATYAYSNDDTPVTWILGAWRTDGTSYPPDGHGRPECPTLATCFIGGTTTVSRSS
ncbi:hypothetical protein GCM10009868_00160 [Terrabacter aerolatus]|uniref:Fibronectin type-III domain-containing protein n=1 Tax=Terrabacter aerolatus TaxID=422442 RepID=A0A512D312_9MICO|nr:hypothetical protein TAE01_26620 [Terrabacter aerolatus]